MRDNYLPLLWHFILLTLGRLVISFEWLIFFEATRSVANIGLNLPVKTFWWMMYSIFLQVVGKDPPNELIQWTREIIRYQLMGQFDLFVTLFWLILGPLPSSGDILWYCPRHSPVWSYIFFILQKHSLFNAFL